MQSYKTAYAAGNHLIKIKAQYIGYALSEVSETFTLNLIDPCESSVLTIAAVPIQELYVG